MLVLIDDALQSEYSCIHGWNKMVGDPTAEES